jgi:hypothetical protein
MRGKELSGVPDARKAVQNEMNLWTQTDEDAHLASKMLTF